MIPGTLPIRRTCERVRISSRKKGRNRAGTMRENRRRSPAGKSNARDSTMVNPEDEDPIDPQSPKLPPA